MGKFAVSRNSQDVAESVKAQAELDKNQKTLSEATAARDSLRKDLEAEKAKPFWQA